MQFLIVNAIYNNICINLIYPSFQAFPIGYKVRIWQTDVITERNRVQMRRIKKWIHASCVCVFVCGRLLRGRDFFSNFSYFLSRSLPPFRPLFRCSLANLCRAWNKTLETSRFVLLPSEQSSRLSQASG